MTEIERNSELSEGILKDIFSILPCPIYIWKSKNEDFILSTCNNAAEQLSQGKTKNLLGVKSTELFKENPEIIEDLHRCFNQKINFSKDISAKFKFLDKDLYFNVDYFYIAPDFVLLNAHNITEQKTLQEILSKAEREKSIILNSARELISYQDKDLKIIWANKAGAESVNMKLEELIGRHCYEIWPRRNEPCENCPVSRSMKTGLPEKGEQQTPDGRYWSISGNPVKDENGNVLGAVEITTEITELKLSQNKLKESEKRYREAYNRLNLYKDLFTHDVNNVFQNILSSNELIMLYSNNPEKLQDFVEVANLIKEQVIRGAKLVSNVQLLSNLEEETISLYPIELFKVLKDIIKKVKTSHLSNEIQINIESEQEQYKVIANELLSEIFENILTNSIKHNKNSVIDILIKISKNGKNVKLEFVDNGIGIPDSMKEVIFERELNRDK
ncbi:MAG: PAS domain-containing protein, partial [Promethearchaeota archaeon]